MEGEGEADDPDPLVLPPVVGELEEDPEDPEDPADPEDAGGAEEPLALGAAEPLLEPPS